MPQVLPISSIIPADCARRLNPEHVAMLAESIIEIGLQAPISVRLVPYRRLGSGPVYQMVAGTYRLEACKSLGWTVIPATILDLDDIDCQLWQIDENLVRAELTMWERAEYLQRRKILHEQKHPETRHGGARKSHPLGPREMSFVADTASRTGMSRSAISHSIRRAKAIAPGVREAIRSMPEVTDSGVELDALAAMGPEEQKAAVEAVKSGQALSIREAVLAASNCERKRAPSDEEIVRQAMVAAVKLCRRKIVRRLASIHINCAGNAINVAVKFLDGGSTA
jgi:ParB family transcriptional regulator, chromosome partitioning protein